nr:acetyl-CoA synthase [Desulfobacterales bacterium]
QDASPEDAAAVVKKVLAAINVPLIVWGTANPQKDEDVLKKIAEETQGEQLILGPVEDKNHKGIGAAAMGFGHTLISSSPIDVNLAKQVNILLENLGMPMERVIIDPTTGGLGYGLEYTYSVMERLRMAALNQGDDKLQMPIINNVGNEVWKCKEAKQDADEAPTLGDPEKRGIMMEAVAAVSYLASGADVLVMRHPESIRLTKEYIDLVYSGGSASDVAAVTKRLDDVDIDLAALAPEPDLKIEEEKKAAPAPAKKAAPAKAAPAAKPAPAKPAPAPAAEAAPAPAPEPEAPKVDAAAEAAAKAKAEAEAKVKAEADAQAQAEAAAKAKAEAEAKAKAEAEAKAKADAETKAKAAAAAKAKMDAEIEEMRALRAKQREKLAAERAVAEKEMSLTPDENQVSMVQKLIDNANRIHKR